MDNKRAMRAGDASRLGCCIPRLPLLTASLTAEPVQVLEQVDGTSCCASSPVLLRRWYVPSLRVARHRVEVENADGFGLHACGKAWLPFTHGGRYGFGLHSRGGYALTTFLRRTRSFKVG